MKNKINSGSNVSQEELTSSAAPDNGTGKASRTIVPVADLKTRFKAQSVPLESDFANLIDMAHAGCNAVGLSVDTPGVGDGLKLSGPKLAVKSAENGALTIGATGVSVNRGNGLTKSLDTVQVGGGTGIKVNPNDIAVNYAPYGGLDYVKTAGDAGGSSVPGQLKLFLDRTDNSTCGLYVDNAKGLSVKAGYGIRVGTDVSLKFQTNSALFATAEGASVNRGNGLKKNTNDIQIGEGVGISVDANAVSVKAASTGGILVDAAGVGLNLDPQSPIAVNSNGGIYLEYKSPLSLGLSGEDPVLQLAYNRNEFEIIEGHGFSLKRAMPSGMVTMFAGEKIPDNWTLCDGKDKRTPDLSKQFIANDDPATRAARPYTLSYIMLTGADDA